MIYVYELPDRLSNGFCFGGGTPVTFKNVDFWNDPHPDSFLGQPAPTVEEMRAFIKCKRYYRPERAYLVLAPDLPQYTFTIPPHTQGAEG